MKDKISNVGSLVSAFASVTRREGLGAAVSRTSQYLARRSAGNSESKADNDRTVSYRLNKENQRRYIEAYFDRPIPSRQAALDETLGEIGRATPVVIAPTAYDRDMTQRPDHLLRAFAERGYLVLQIVIDSEPKYIRRRQSNYFVTNLFEDVILRYRHSNPILYIHYAFFGYLTALIRESTIIYDVLDDISLFSGYGVHLESDHSALLRQSNVQLFSSKHLMANSVGLSSKALLVENGVWTRDFRREGKEYVAPNDTVRVGYHGAISELLDFDLLAALAELSTVELTLVGPVVAFDPGAQQRLEERFRLLEERKNVRYLGKVTYNEVVDYLQNIDLGVVPFLVNHVTDAVSPLKLFEYAAAGKPVLCTPTKTMSEYGDTLLVVPPSEWCRKITEGEWKRYVGRGVSALADAHDWDRVTAPIFDAIEHRVSSRAEVHVAAATRRVDILNVNFFDWNGDELYKGGAERYILDLAKLCRTLGMDPRIRQNANRPFTREVDGIPVIGDPAGSGWNFERLSRSFARRSLGDFVIASPVELACELESRSAVIGINHGIHWDAPAVSLSRAQDHSTLFRSVGKSFRTVCVDTNFVNWMRTRDRELSESLVYIANYVDISEFRPTQKTFEGRLRFLYPRRLYAARGLHLTLDVFDELFQEGLDLHLTLCGQADIHDTRIVEKFLDRHRSRCAWVQHSMSEMPEVYSSSDVVLIPTIHSEGTSLSCLEAFATNNAVIASDIGGLPNLVLDGINGLLIRPSAQELKRSILNLYGDRELCRTLATAALSHAEAFSKQRWLKSWEKIIHQGNSLLRSGVL